MNQQQFSHIDQHQRDKNLVGVKACFQKSGHGGPGHTTQDAKQHHAWQDEQVGTVKEINGGRATQKCSGNELALCADVPDARTKAQRKTHPDQDQRTGFHRNLG